MSPLLEAAFTIGAWALVILILSGGWWFLRRNNLLHTAVIAVLSLAGLFLLMKLQELVVMLLLAGVLAFILDPLIQILSRKMRRPAAVGLVFLGFVAFCALVLTLLIPRVVGQARGFVHALPEYSQQARSWAVGAISRYGGTDEQAQDTISSTIQQGQALGKSVSGEVERVLLDVLKWTVKLGVILVICVYLLLDEERIREGFLNLFAEDNRDDVRRIMGELATVFSSYLRGQGTVILFVAIAATLVLLFLRIPYAFFIGFLAGTLEVVPYFGALAGAIPAVILGFMNSTGTGIGVIIGFVVINQLEGHLVIPLVMGRNLEMRPLAILLALIGGEMVAGIVGMIVAVPLVSLVRVLIPHARIAYAHFRARELRRAQSEAPFQDSSAEPPAPG